MLDYLARNMIDTGVLVLVCARLGEMVERALGEHVLFGLEQDGVLTRLDLQPLTGPMCVSWPNGCSTAICAIGPGWWLFRESQGNPLFAVSLLDAVVDTGVDLAAPRLAAIPPALSARVAERVQALDEHSRSVLDLLAVVGRPTDLEELRRFHSSPAPSVARLRWRGCGCSAVARAMPMVIRVRGEPSVGPGVHLRRSGSGPAPRAAPPRVALALTA